MGWLSKAFVVVALACAIAGCGRQMSQAQSKALTSGSIQVDMPRSEVERQLGYPNKIEKVGTTAFFFYAPGWYLPSIAVGSYSPIAIADGKVVGIGKAYHDAALASASAAAASN